MNAFRLTVPGNLLLAGEYAVLEEGGLGAALAVQPRLTVTVFPQEQWQIEGRWTGGGERWDPEAGTPPTFAGLVFLKALELLEGRGDERGRNWSHRTKPARIEVDSSSFFDAQGRKLGYGSSAALAVGITAALARLADREVGPAVHQAAVAAHRHAQNGAGSGYDVTVSWFGGFGRFTGGAEPGWQPADLSLLPPLALFPGPEAVRTTGSITRYRAWQAADPEGARNFLEASNAAVTTLLQAKSPQALRNAWEDCRHWGIDLGDRVGSEARLAVPSGLPDDTFVKALGAGNETGLAAGFGAGQPAFPGRTPSLRPLVPSAEGLRWE